MSTHEALQAVLETLPEHRLREVLSFAEFLRLKQEQEDWQRAGLTHFAQCFGPDEPDYGDAPA